MIATIAPGDEAALLALNNAHAAELSALSAERFSALLKLAFSARVAGSRAAFLLAFDQSAAYDSLNYRWFKARYERFIYVDRIVVAPSARGQGLARLLYADLMARLPDDRILACEVNLDPPNPASDALHGSLGFTEVGRAEVGAKLVRYLARPPG